MHFFKGCFLDIKFLCPLQQNINISNFTVVFLSYYDGFAHTDLYKILFLAADDILLYVNKIRQNEPGFMQCSDLSSENVCKCVG